MFDVNWDASGQKRWENGLDRGVLYPPGRRAVAWNGLISVDEATEDSKTETIWFDGVKRYNHVTPGDFSGTLTAVTYPDEFLEFDGYHEATDGAGIYIDNQYRPSFGLSYRTLFFDENGNTDGYKIHILYNLIASPSSKDRKSISDSVEPQEFSWDIIGTPVDMPSPKPSAHIMVDTRKSYPETVAILESILYGSETTSGRLPTAQEILDLSQITVVHNGDGTATITGPDSYVYEISAGKYGLDIFGVEDVGPQELAISSS